MTETAVLTSSLPPRIAVIGAVKIGSTFAFQLSRTGRHDVTVVARPGSLRLQQLQRDGAIINIAGERVEVGVTDKLDETVPYDLVVVTILDYQIDAILPTLQRSAARCIQFMFNTFGPDRLRKAVGAVRCAFGMPFLQATLDADGRLKATIGAAGQKTIMSEQRWVDVFQAAGIPAVVESNMPRWLRCHVPLCVAFESVSVAGVRRGGGASWGEALVLARGMHASYDVIKGLGYGIYPMTKKRLAGSPTWLVASMLWSMSRIRPFRELLASGKAECNALVDSLAVAAGSAKRSETATAIKAMRPS